MANWSGSFTNNTPTGTSSGGNTSTTFNDAFATWPTGAFGLTNFFIRILTGTGAGQERKIVTNSDKIISIATSWTTIPDNTSTYEIVHILEDQDHIVGDLTLGTGIISEVRDSATVLVDGNYLLIFNNNVITRWEKTPSTLVTIQANSRTTQGSSQFWGRVEFGSSLTVNPKMKYIRIRDSLRAFLIRPSNVLYDDIQKIWIQNCSQIVWYLTPTLMHNFTLKDFYIEDTNTGLLDGQSTSSVYRVRFENFWFERPMAFGLAGGSGLNIPNIRELSGFVFPSGFTSQVSSHSSPKELKVLDCYLKSNQSTSSLFRITNASFNGIVRGHRNVLHLGQEFAYTVEGGATNESRFNDFIGHRDISRYALISTVVSRVMTSDYDYISGRNDAAEENVDTSHAVNSTNTPQQYLGLSSARTNARSQRNRPLSIDNISTSGITYNEASISFDSVNGDTSPASVVNGDSNSGQPTLFVSSTSGRSVGEYVEIGYGTARYERRRILSINTGISLTFENNLTFTHTAAQADVVKKNLRTHGIAFVKYGTVSGNLNQQTLLPPQKDWGLFYTGVQSSYLGESFSFKQVGHSLTLKKLLPATTYYWKACYFNPLGELVESSEMSFVTLEDPTNTDPGVDNVRDGVGYVFEGSNKTGNLLLPSVSDVRDGQQYGANGTEIEGTLDLPSVNDVRDGIFFDGASKEGLLNLPDESDVRNGVPYDNGTKGGTLINSDPGVANVLVGVPYTINNVLLVGTLQTDYTDLLAQVIQIKNNDNSVIVVLEEDELEVSIEDESLVILLDDLEE